MSNITASVVVQPVNLNVTSSQNNLNIIPEGINLNVVTNSGGGTGTSSDGQLLYNNLNVLTGVPNTSFASGNLFLGNVSNVRIGGGTNGQVLQTDGTGTLTWVTITGGGGGGNANPGGSVNQIQFNLDGANFGGFSGFTINQTNGDVNMPGNLAVLGNITGNVQTAVVAQTVSNAIQSNITSVGILTGLQVSGPTLLGPISNVQISGGASGQVLQTDGANSLSWTTKLDGQWTTPSQIPIGGTFIGQRVSFNSTNNAVPPGQTFVSNSSPDLTSLTGINAGIGPNVSIRTAGVDSSGIYVVGSNNILRRAGPENINSVVTITGPGFNIRTPVTRGRDNIVVFSDTFANLSQSAAFSTNNGQTWTRVSLPIHANDFKAAYGNEVFVRNGARSTNDGQTWTSSPATGKVIFADNGFFYAGPFARSVDGAAFTDPLPGRQPLPSGFVSITTWTVGGGRTVLLDSAVSGSPLPRTPFFATYNNTDGSVVGGALPNTSAPLYTNVIYTGSNYIACTGRNYYIISSDGINWSSVSTVFDTSDVDYDPGTNTIILYTRGSTSSTLVYTARADSLYVRDSLGNNPTAVTNGTYRSLGGVLDGRGTLWTRVA